MIQVVDLLQAEYIRYIWKSLLSIYLINIDVTSRNKENRKNRTYYE